LVVTSGLEYECLEELMCRRNEPEIVKELREAERVGLLSSRASGVYDNVVVFERTCGDKGFLETTVSSADVDFRGFLYEEKLFKVLVEQNIMGVVVTRNGRVVFL